MLLTIGLRNWLSFRKPGDFNMSEGDFTYTYLKDLPNGCRVHVMDPHLGPLVYDVTIVQKRVRDR